MACAGCENGDPKWSKTHTRQRGVCGAFIPAIADGDGSKPRRPAHCHIKPPDYKESSKKRKKYAPTDPQTHRRNERTRYQGFQDPIKRACMRGGSNPHYISRGNPRRKKKSDP